MAWRCPAATAAPAWRRSSPTTDLDLAALRAHLAQRLPDYARPVFLRIRSEIDVTATFKQKKVDLVKEGFDPSAISRPDLFQRSRGSKAFVRLQPDHYRQISDGRIRL